jgi:hypothetical protein
MEDQQQILALRGPPVTSGPNEATTILFPCNTGGRYDCLSVLLVWLVLEWLVVRTHDELAEIHTGCVYFLKKKYCTNKRFPVISNLRYIHGVLNVDEIKN